MQARQRREAPAFVPPSPVVSVAAAAACSRRGKRVDQRQINSRKMLESHLPPRRGCRPILLAREAVGQLSVLAVQLQFDENSNNAQISQIARYVVNR